MNAEKILFRCSSLHHLMTEPKSKAAKEAGELSESAKTHLIDVFVRAKYGRQTELDNKYLRKGNEAEENSITLYALAHRNMFYKNEERLSNMFICGTPDLGDKKPITESKHTIDTKTSWDIFTFTRAKYKEIPNNNYWQGVGYLALTGAEKHTVAYCLVNTPFHLVQSELYRENYKHADNNTPAAIELNIIANHVYDRKVFDEYINRRGCPADTLEAKEIIDSFVEIPLAERIFEFKIARDEKEIERLYERIKMARGFMNAELF